MQILLRWTIYVPAVALGLVLWSVNLSQEYADLVASFLVSPLGRMLVGIPAGMFLIMPLFLILRWWQLARRSREISYTTESGRVSVNLVAVEEALTRVIEAEEEVRKAHVRVYEDRVRRGVVIEAAATLWEVPNVTERNRVLQRLLRRRFAELMPEQQSVQVNLTVHRLQVRPTVATPNEADPNRVTTSTSLSARLKAKVSKTPNPAPVPAAAAVPLRPALRGRDDSDAGFEPNDDLYVGPSYPVAPDEDEGGTAAYHAKQAGNSPGKTKR